MKALLKKFIQDESGATAVEYAIMVALIAVVVIAAVALIGNRANNAFSTVGGCLNNADSC